MDIHDCGILIVDDEENIRSLIRWSLEDLGFKNVIAVPDRMQCIDKLREYGDNIVIIFLDIKLRNENGLDIIKYIREYENKVIGIIIHTAFSFYKGDLDDIVSIENERIEILDYLVKSSSLRDLVESLRNNIPKVLERRREIMSIGIEQY